MVRGEGLEREQFKSRTGQVSIAEDHVQQEALLVPYLGEDDGDDRGQEEAEAEECVEAVQNLHTHFVLLEDGSLEIESTRVSEGGSQRGTGRTSAMSGEASGRMESTRGGKIENLFRRAIGPAQEWQSNEK